jgi:FeS assembly SUF system protein
MSEKTDATPDGAAGATPSAALKDRVVAVIREIYDPEIPVNIYDLGLIYSIETDEDAGKVDIKMTLTSPACPVAGSLPPEVETKVRNVAGVREVDVELVWDPPWDKEMMSEEIKLQLGIL